MIKDNIWQYKGAIAAFLIFFVLIVPIPKIASLFLIWVIVLLLCNILSECWIFSLFVASTFVGILFIFLLMRSKDESLEFRQAFIENFADLDKKLSDDKSKETKEVKEDDKKLEIKASNDKEEKKVEIIDRETPKEKKEVEVIVEEKKIPKSVDDIKLEDYGKLDKPNKIEIKATPQKLPLKKISMMDSDDALSDDVFGKLNISEFEDSDEDSDDSEGELEKKAGKTTVSSKKSYKAQKQLYDLTTAVNKLHDNMEKLAPSLKKGQKIIESIQSMGISFT